MTNVDGISHLLLDIEGTTCPVNFVAETLFPYAANRLEPFLLDQASQEPVQSLLRDVEHAWQCDSDTHAQALLRQTRQMERSTAADDELAVVSTAAYLRLLIEQDRKLTALKDLQGMIWEAGYANGDLVAPLFADVPPALQRWHNAGMVLAVYSSGSVWAQQLLYTHSSAGDLRHLFTHWFDTRNGAKQQPESYRSIANTMCTAPETVLFISDALAECEAARIAGMAVIFSTRPGNPSQDAGPFKPISDYTNLLA